MQVQRNAELFPRVVVAPVGAGRVITRRKASLGGRDADSVRVMSLDSIRRLSPALSLAGLEPFAKGSKRLCYVHPGDVNLCVKVLSRADDKLGHAEQRKELEDYQLLKERGPETVFDRIPVMVGIVATDLGDGIVYRICRDADGRISRNLGDLIRAHGLTPPLVGAIDELKQWQREQRLLTRDTGPHNVVAVSLGSNEWKLVIIEGWVNRKFRWLTRRHRTFAEYMMGRELRKFNRRVAGLARMHDRGP